MIYLTPIYTEQQMAVINGLDKSLEDYSQSFLSRLPKGTTKENAYLELLNDDFYCGLVKEIMAYKSLIVPKFSPQTLKTPRQY